MANRLWGRRLSVLVLLLAARTAGAASPADGGGVLGWVEDTRGAPVAGAVISIFGKGVGGSGLTTLSDSAGRFFLPSLPAGSYTLRALGAGHLPAPARLITVLPNRDSTFTVSLTPVGDGDAAARAITPSDDKLTRRELTWLLRHKRRSVLETRDASQPEGEKAEAPENRRLLASFHPDLTGSVELVTNPADFGSDGPGPDEEPASLSVLRLRGRIAESGSWSLGGLVSESENTIWRMAAEFVLAADEGHELQMGSGYGARWRRPMLPSERAGRLDDRSVGALFLQDHWELDERLTATIGGRFTHVGFLDDANHFDPIFALELRHDAQTRVRGSVATRTVVPGGDLLTLSSLATAPAISYATIAPGLRPERSVRVELGLDQVLGSTRIGAHTFYEGVRDQLHNGFDATADGRDLQIANVGPVGARGMGLTVARRVGDCVTGSMSYTYGHSWRSSHPAAPAEGDYAPAVAIRSGDFHDLVGKVETVLESSDTRLVAYYRVTRLVPVGESHAMAPVRTSRYDLQLSQGLPFLGSLTGADWDLLVAVRNLYYEPSEGALLDEMAVANPPRRVLGGIAVRF